MEVGDTVQYKDLRKCEITYKYKLSDNYNVKFDTGGTRLVKAKDLTPLNQTIRAQMQNNTDLKVGDTVKLKDGCEHYYISDPLLNRATGEIVEIKDEENYGLMAYVKEGPNNKLMCYYLNTLEKVNNTMTDFYVKVDGPQHSRMLQEMAFSNGYSWNNVGKKVSCQNQSYLLFNKSNSIFYGKHEEGFNDKYKKLEDYTINEFVNALHGRYNFQEPITIQGYEVEFFDTYIEISCKTYQFTDIIDISGLMSRNNIKEILIDSDEEDVWVTYDQIKQIVNRIND